jgi:nucleotide-binding universal stress UspA family protein
MYRRILVALKDITTQDAVIQHAVGLAQATKAVLILVHVTHTHALDASAYQEQGARVQLERRAAEAHQLGIQTEVMVVEGEPWEEICLLAENGSFDLLVMGKHAHSEVRDLVAGSVTEQLIRHCRMPILLVESKHHG